MGDRVKELGGTEYLRQKKEIFLPDWVKLEKFSIIYTFPLQKFL
jgi:hypothetical protein